MQEASGLWHKHFLEWLAMRNPKSIVTFADKNEIPRHSDPNLTVQYIVDYVDSYQADVLVDDAHDGEDVPPMKSTHEYFSLKKQGESFVTKESRLFSHIFKEQKSPFCPCKICQILHTIASSYKDLHFLQDSVVQLGHIRCARGPCTSYLDSDFSRVSVKVREVVKTGLMKALTPQDERIVPRVLSILGKTMDEDGRVGERSALQESKLLRGWASQYGYRYKGENCAHIDCSCDLELFSASRTWLISKTIKDKEKYINSIIQKEGKTLEGECHIVRHRRVEFVGVSSDFFFPTPLDIRGGPAEIAVVSDVARLNQPYPYVFSMKDVPGYDRMSYSWRGFFLHIARASSRYVFNIKGLPPLVSKYKLSPKRLVSSLLHGEFFFVHRRSEWEVDMDPIDSLFRIRIHLEDAMIDSLVSPSEPPIIRSSFLVDWIRGQDLRDPRSLHFRWQLLLELKSYCSAGLVSCLYAKVLKCLPPEVIDKIDCYILPLE